MISSIPKSTPTSSADLQLLEQLQKDALGYINILKQDQARLLASINSLSLGFIIVDVKSNILIKNNAVDQILELKDMEGNVLLKGDIIAITDRLKDSFDLQTKWEESLKEKKSFKFKDISFGAKYLQIFIAPIIVELSEAIGVVIVIEDVTDAKVLERSKDEFFSIASHELRTPLTAIRGNTSMILDYYAKDIVHPDLKTMIADIHDSSTRLISIVNDFLNMSRLEQRRMEYKSEQVPLGEIAKRIISELTVNASEKGIIIINTIDEKMRVWADYGKVEQILLNLVGNSLKFTKTGTITISAQGEKECSHIEVSDTGCGIPLTSQSLLFRKFQQAASSIITRDATQGTGLGLYISRLMAEGMGGALSLVKSTPEGSVFRLTLPMNKK